MRKYTYIHQFALFFMVIALFFTACTTQPMPTPTRSMPTSTGPMPSDSAPISATKGNDLGCNTADIANKSKLSRIDPEWVSINSGAPYDQPTILEGTINPYAGNVAPDTAVPSAIAEDDNPFSHTAHDMQFDVTPDPGYGHLRAAYQSMDTQGNISNHINPFVHVEHETNPVFDARYWPTVGDRVWMSGRWIFDCGHNGLDNSKNSLEVNKCGKACVKYGSEIHPPRALVVFRLNHGGLVNLANQYTWVPVTQADVFISGDGGAANDRCNLIGRHMSIIPIHVDSCSFTGPVIPINDRNYVFDVYPPGTHYTPYMNGNNQLTNPYNPNLTFVVTPPSPTAFVQATSFDNIGGIQPFLCLVDATTPPPTQTETSCPPQPARPTRVRVIVPSKGSQGVQMLRQSILVSWNIPPVKPIHTFKIRLHEFKVVDNGDINFAHGDWRMYANVGGQWRYLNGLSPDTSNPNCKPGDGLGNNGAGDCFQFDNSPWTVTVPDGASIHVALGGYESDTRDSVYCTYHDSKPNDNCTPNLKQGFQTADDKVGSYEFDLTPQTGYAAPAKKTVCCIQNAKYDVSFQVQEVPTPAPRLATFKASPTSSQIDCTVNPSSGIQFPVETIKNNGPVPIDWSVTTSEYQIHPAPTSGRLAPGQSQGVQLHAEPGLHLSSSTISIKFISRTTNGDGTTEDATATDICMNSEVGLG